MSAPVCSQTIWFKIPLGKKKKFRLANYYVFELRQVPYLLDLSFITCKMGIVFVFVCLGSFILVSVFYILKVFLGNLMIATWIHVCQVCRGGGGLQNGVKRQRTEFFIEGTTNVILCLVLGLLPKKEILWFPAWEGINLVLRIWGVQ